VVHLKDWQGFWEEFEAQYNAGGFFMLIIHPFLTGRLARWRQVEAWIKNTKHEKDVWFATLDEIADHMDKAARRWNLASKRGGPTLL
jgi:hypothetical protein